MNKRLALTLFALLFALLTGPAWAASKTVTLALPTMDCPVCPITVKKALVRVAGVSKAEVNFDKRQAVINFDDAQASVETLMRATRDAGYPSTLAATAK